MTWQLEITKTPDKVILFAPKQVYFRLLNCLHLDVDITIFESE